MHVCIALFLWFCWFIHSNYFKICFSCYHLYGEIKCCVLKTIVRPAIYLQLFCRTRRPFRSVTPHHFIIELLSTLHTTGDDTTNITPRWLWRYGEGTCSSFCLTVPFAVYLYDELSPGYGSGSCVCVTFIISSTVRVARMSHHGERCCDTSATTAGKVAQVVTGRGAGPLGHAWGHQSTVGHYRRQTGTRDPRTFRDHAVALRRTPWRRFHGRMRRSGHMRRRRRCQSLENLQIHAPINSVIATYCWLYGE